MILIVDDDPEFLQEAERLLDQRRGVFFAGDADHAKALMGAVGADFSLALIDLDLPNQDGVSLIREFTRQFPSLPVIAISAVRKPAVLDSARIFGAHTTLHKPIGPEWRAAIASAQALATSS